MSRNNSTMITPSRERGQHLKFEDRVSIKIYRKLKYTLRAIADVVLCQDLKQIKMRIFHRKINICSLSCIYTII